MKAKSRLGLWHSFLISSSICSSRTRHLYRISGFLCLSWNDLTDHTLSWFLWTYRTRTLPSNFNAGLGAKVGNCKEENMKKFFLTLISRYFLFYLVLHTEILRAESKTLYFFEEEFNSISTFCCWWRSDEPKPTSTAKISW